MNEFLRFWYHSFYYMSLYNASPYQCLTWSYNNYLVTVMTPKYFFHHCVVIFHSLERKLVDDSRILFKIFCLHTKLQHPILNDISIVHVATMLLTVYYVELKITVVKRVLITEKGNNQFWYTNSKSGQKMFLLHQFWEECNKHFISRFITQIWPMSVILPPCPCNCNHVDSKNQWLWIYKGMDHIYVWHGEIGWWHRRKWIICTKYWCIECLPQISQNMCRSVVQCSGMETWWFSVCVYSQDLYYMSGQFRAKSVLASNKNNWTSIVLLFWLLFGRSG